MKTKYSDLIEIRESAIAFKIHPENGDWRDFIPNGQFNDVLRKVTNAVYTTMQTFINHSGLPVPMVAVRAMQEQF